jgi:hypothetical protein
VSRLAIFVLHFEPHFGRIDLYSHSFVELPFISIRIRSFDFLILTTSIEIFARKFAFAFRSLIEIFSQIRICCDFAKLLSNCFVFAQFAY